MYRVDEEVEDAEIVFHNGSELRLQSMPSTGVPDEETLFFCVGEQDYRQSRQYRDLDGIIGTAGLRVLWCGVGEDSRGQPVTRVRIFRKKQQLSLIEEISSLELPYSPYDFQPIGAVWGYFWHSGGLHNLSGFVLYDDDGKYVVVHQDEHTGDWVAEGAPTQPFSNLFENRINPSVLFAYREVAWPAKQFLPARDLLLSVVSEPMIIGLYLQWRSGTESSMALNSCDEIFFDGAPGSMIEHASFRRVWGSNKTRFFFGGEGIMGVYNSTPVEFPTGWEGISATNTARNGNDWGTVNGPMRVRHTRRPWVNTLLYKRFAAQGTSSDVSVRFGRIDSWNEQSDTLPGYATTELLFENLSSIGSGQAGHDLGAYDIMFEYGIAETTEEDNCLFANIQSFGRYQQESATFMPSHNTGYMEADTLLYMTVAPIVHGCRGISFYGLDMALLCGSPDQTSAYRMPNRLLNWGPSRDGDSNGDIDMVDRVHDVVKMLTGGHGGPDFLGALVDQENWTVLDEDQAVNASYSTHSGFTPFSPMDELNFIALMENATEDILLIVANDYPSDPDSYAGSLIWFPELESTFYNAPECWGGFESPYWSDAAESVTAEEISTVERVPVVDNAALGSIAVTSSATVNHRAQPDLAVSFSTMLPHTVSLIRIPRKTSDASSSSARTEQVFSLWRDSDGDVTMELSGYSGNCELVVYDVTGRIVSELFDGELLEEGAVFHLRADEFQRGMYFAVLMQDGEMINSEKLLMR